MAKPRSSLPKPPGSLLAKPLHFFRFRYASTAMVACLFPAIAALSTSGLAQNFTGQPAARDGDTLDFGLTEVRLAGIDAPELGQQCQRGGDAWACGEEARNALADLLAGAQIECRQQGMDSDGVALATCTAGSVDLADALTTVGMAIALDDADPAYSTRAERARQLRLGIWAGEFVLPADFRAADPAFLQQRERRWRVARAAQAASTVERAPLVRAEQREIYFRGCDEVRAAGRAPLYRGQPGYRPGMDGDGDGIACEPIRR